MCDEKTILKQNYSVPKATRRVHHTLPISNNSHLSGSQSLIISMYIKAHWIGLSTVALKASNWPYLCGHSGYSVYMVDLPQAVYVHCTLCTYPINYRGFDIRYLQISNTIPKRKLLYFIVSVVFLVGAPKFATEILAGQHITYKNAEIHLFSYLHATGLFFLWKTNRVAN